MSRESTNLSSSLQLNKKLLNQFKNLILNLNIFIFQLMSPIIYVMQTIEVLKNMESVILANDGIVIRIGYYLLSNELNHKKIPAK